MLLLVVGSNRRYTRNLKLDNHGNHFKEKQSNSLWGLCGMWETVSIMLDWPNESTVAHLDPVKGSGICD